MTGPSDYISLNLICVVALGALGLRRLVRMERLHWLRVVMLTLLLWVPVFYLFSLAVPPSPSCVIDFRQPQAFTLE